MQKKGKKCEREKNAKKKNKRNNASEKQIW